MEWVSLVVDVAIKSVAISHASSRRYARLHQGSLTSLARSLAHSLTHSLTHLPVVRSLHFEPLDQKFALGCFNVRPLIHKAVQDLVPKLAVGVVILPVVLVL